jgi:CyaY protein
MERATDSRDESFMNDTEFNTRADATIEAIEAAVEALDSDTDIDFETSAGILTLTFESGSKVIINRQIATHEIWVAAKSGGFHCRAEGEGWFCNTTGETLPQLLSRVCSEQAGTGLTLSW